MIPKLKLLEEKLDRNKKVPEYKIPYLYKCWLSNKKFLDKIYRNERSIAYVIPYRIQFFKLNINFELGKKIKSSEKPVKVFNNHFKNNNNRLDSFVYTDGSKTDKGCGFAVYSPKMTELKYKINKLNSIYNAEAYGILYALEWIRDNNLDKIGIFTDSQSVLERLDNLGLKSECNHIIGKILCLLYELILVQNRNIIFYWIPSHVGIPGNDKVDRLAKEAINNIDFCSKEICFKDVYGVFKLELKDKMINYVNDYDFGRGLKGRRFIELNDKFDYSPWFSNYALDRKRITIINRIRSNHTRTKAHLFKKNITSSDLCGCGGIQTVDHLIWECLDASSIREPLIRYLNSKGIMRYDDICKIFNKANMDVILSIVDYILQNKILI